MEKKELVQNINHAVLQCIVETAKNYLKDFGPFDQIRIIKQSKTEWKVDLGKKWKLEGCFEIAKKMISHIKSQEVYPYVQFICLFTFLSRKHLANLKDKSIRQGIVALCFEDTNRLIEGCIIGCQKQEGNWHPVDELWFKPRDKDHHGKHHTHMNKLH